MDFQGKHQAFIAANFNLRLKEEYGKEHGNEIFVHIAHLYAEERGHRMAQRALRDGRKLDAHSYEQYRELLAGHTIDFASMCPDFIMHVIKCEWADTYEELGLEEEGFLYCSEVDTSLNRGFNPAMPYEMTPRAEGFRCVHHIENANFVPGTDLSPIPGTANTLEYHCGNMYWDFTKTIEAICGAKGVKIAAKVLADFEEKYGTEMADRIVLYRNLDYTVCNGGIVEEFKG